MKLESASHYKVEKTTYVISFFSGSQCPAMWPHMAADDHTHRILNLDQVMQIRVVWRFYSEGHSNDNDI